MDEAMNKLYRSQRDKKIAGLCGGLGEAFNVDANLLRLILVITVFFSAGSVIFLYIIACLVIPKEPLYPEPYGFDAGSGYQQGPYNQPFTSRTNVDSQTQTGVGQQSHLDEMMKDIEKKALQKEIEELRAKLAKYEKGE